MTTPKLHVILGAGQIGPLVAERLLKAGHRVRLVRRGPSTGGPPGVDVRSVDLADPAAAAEVMTGAEVVYHCVTPAYERWGELLLPLQRGILEGARRASAHLVVLDNLYGYGRAPGGKMNEDTRIAPCSKKGELRAEAAALLLAARDRGELSVTIGRASDFIGPGATMASIFGERFWQRVMSGKSGECFGDPDAPHSYSYVGDVAAGLVTLGTDPRARDQVWHLPVNAAEPTRQLIARVGRQMGKELNTSRVPTWVLRMMGWFVPVVGELVEMTYQWEGPFVLNDAKFRGTFGYGATPWEQALPPTIQWAKARWGSKAAPREAHAES